MLFDDAESPMVAMNVVEAASEVTRWMEIEWSESTAADKSTGRGVNSE